MEAPAEAVRLELGSVRFVLDRFTFVEVTPRADIFPEAAYAEAMREGAAGIQSRLEVVNLLARARRADKDGKRTKAIELLETASQKSNRSEVKVALGRALLEEGEESGARRAFKAALKLDDLNPAARLGLAELLAKGDDPLSAIETLEPIIESGMIAPRAFVLMAGLKSRRGDDRGALELLQSASKYGAGTDPDFYLQLGALEHRIGNEDRALAAFRQALSEFEALRQRPEKDDERSALQLYYLGRAAIESGDEPTGVALLEAAAKADDAVPDASFYLGKALLERRKPKAKRRGATGTRELSEDGAPSRLARRSQAAPQRTMSAAETPVSGAVPRASLPGHEDAGDDPIFMLRRVDAFRELTGGEYRQLTEAGEVIEVPQDRVIPRAGGDEPTYMYFVLKGQVAFAEFDKGKVPAPPKNKKKRVPPVMQATHRNISLFEIDDFFANDHVADARSDDGIKRDVALYTCLPAKLFRIRKSDLDEILASVPQIAEAIEARAEANYYRQTFLKLEHREDIFDFYVKQGFEYAQAIKIIQTDKCIDCDECIKGCEDRHGVSRIERFRAADWPRPVHAQLPHLLRRALHRPV